MRRVIQIALFGLLTVVGCRSYDSSELRQQRNANLKLWYTSPANEWVEALPVGNGRLGAMVFGGVTHERIQLNEESVWAGRRENNNNPGALENLGEIRRLLLEGRNAEALVLAEEHLVGRPPAIRSYQTLGDLFFEFHGNSGALGGYRRDLDLQTGVASVEYMADGGRITREVFASAPHDVLVMHVRSEGEPLNFTVRLTRERDATVEAVAPNALAMRGQIVDTVHPWRGAFGEHLRFHSLLYARNKGGRITAELDQLTVVGAESVTLLLTAATDYNLDSLNFDRSIDPEAICNAIIERVKAIPYAELKEAHVADHQSLFDRVSLKLGSDGGEDIPTDVRLDNVIRGGEDNHLAELYFQYGRYLLMGSSRSPGRLPANLQGIWNEHFDAPWESDYHVNINLQMNYWPAEVTNLPETSVPLINFFYRIQDPGQETAREMYGAGGWAMHHVTDMYGRTGLMNAIKWGTFPLGGAWMSLSLWEHYLFNGNREYLRDVIYPIMKGSSLFLLDFMVEDSLGRLVTAPSYSPENAFIDPKTGQEMQLTYSATMDVQITIELFNACIQAAKILGDDEQYIQRLRESLARLPEVKVGADGTIREWIEDYQEAEPGHRHISHLFALHPGSQVLHTDTVFFEAARRTIERRLAHGGAHTGWSRAWIINLYARLLNGEEAYKHFLELLRQSTLRNLFDTHPPFQIDGNFGGTAGIAEMLIQSHGPEILILPALPRAWADGYALGLKARGNFELDIYWENQKPTQLIVRSGSGGPLRIRCGDLVVDRNTRRGGVYRFDL